MRSRRQLLAEGERGRVAQEPCASACPLGKTDLTGGTEAAVTQDEEKKRGDVAQRDPFDQYLTAEVKRGAVSCRNGVMMWAVGF